MMDCVAARDMMLEAELDELRVQGDGALAEHVKGCAACARIARVLVEETERLDAALRASGRVPDLQPLVRRASLGVEATATPGRWSRARAGFGAVLAVAAAAAALWLMPGEGPPRPSGLPQAGSGPLPVVEAAPGHDVAVLSTQDPDITVVMLF